MSKRIEYFFTPISPWTYLGHGRLMEIARRHGAEVLHRPVDLGQVFPATGGLPLAKRAPARQDYRFVELRRWSEHLGLPLVLRPTHFPAPDEWAALAIVAADRAGLDAGRLTGALLAALWAQDRATGERGTVLEVLAECGMPASLIDEAELDGLRAVRQGYTDEALARGVFGAPFFVLDGEPFWGQDRLDFLDRALARG
jgi:carboxymethylenebutenolidase